MIFLRDLLKVTELATNLYKLNIRHMLLPKQVISFVMKRILIVTLFFITITLGVVGVNVNVKAQEQFSCTNASLEGLYGVQGSGFRLSAEGGYVPFGAVNLRNFDGNGNYSGRGITNVNGNFTETNISGIYTVDPDCTVELNDATTSTEGVVDATASTEGVVRNFSQFGTIVDNGREILTLQTSPRDNVQTGIFRKVNTAKRRDD